MFRAIVGADKAPEIRSRPNHLKPTPCERMHFRGHHAHLEALRTKSRQFVDDSRKRPYELVVRCFIMGTICLQQALLLFSIAREVEHLRRERLANLRHIFRLGKLLSQHFLRGVFETFENHVVGIDKRAIVVEQNRG